MNSWFPKEFEVRMFSQKSRLLAMWNCYISLNAHQPHTHTHSSRVWLQRQPVKIMFFNVVNTVDTVYGKLNNFRKVHKQVKIRLMRTHETSINLFTCAATVQKRGRQITQKVTWTHCTPTSIHRLSKVQPPFSITMVTSRVIVNVKCLYYEEK